jgi:hypothetical protein
VGTAPLRPRPVLAAPFVAPAGPYAPGHRGADLRALPGAGVLAAGAGVVAFAGRVSGRGVVSVEHPGGLRTTYQPVAATVRRGEPVSPGQPIGLLEGAGGHCPPQACLHWGLRRGSTYLDPMTLLGRVRVRLLPLWTGDVPAPALPAQVRGSEVGATSEPAAGGRPSEPVGGPTPFVPAALVVGTGLGAVALLRRRAPPV